MTAQRGSRGLALLLLNLGARWRWVANTTPWPLYPWEREPVPIVQQAVWAPWPVWTGAENLAPTGIRSLDRPAPSESLYQPRYPTTGWLRCRSQHRTRNNIIQGNFSLFQKTCTQNKTAINFMNNNRYVIFLKKLLTFYGKLV
jgi:hypothetical protein